MSRANPPKHARTCAGCDGTFYVDRTCLRKRFCSMPCHQKSRKHVRPAARCGTCQTAFDPVPTSPSSRVYGRKFCSHECYSKSLVTAPATLVCEWCKKSVTLSGRNKYELKRPRRRYCSRECFYESVGTNQVKATGRVLRSLRRGKNLSGG